MEAWRGKSAAMALAAMGTVATLVGLAMVESGARAAEVAEAAGDLMSGSEFVRIGGEILVLTGAGMFFASIYAYVDASRRRPEPDRAPFSR